MVNMGRRKEIGKSSDNLFNEIWRDYRGINMRAVIKMGYFLSFVVAAPYKIFQASSGP
jgi:hypothetical protein